MNSVIPVENLLQGVIGRDAETASSSLERHPQIVKIKTSNSLRHETINRQALLMPRVTCRCGEKLNASRAVPSGSTVPSVGQRSGSADLLRRHPEEKRRWIFTISLSMRPTA